MSRSVLRFLVGLVIVVGAIRLMPLLLRIGQGLFLALRSHWWLVLVTLLAVWIWQKRRRRVRGAWRNL